MDIEQTGQLLDYLRSKGLIEADSIPRIRPLTGGVSNRTVLVEFESGEAWVVKQALEKLRVAADWYSSPERIHREAEGARWLEKMAPPGTITPSVSEDHEHHLFIMQAVPQPHENWKSLLLAGLIVPEHVAQFGHLLGTIHKRSRALRHTLAETFWDRTFFETLRLEPYYQYAAEQVPEAGFLNGLIEDTRGRQLTLVHGDYSPKNILVYQDRLVLLDHEVVHFGDPAFDIGFSLTHLLSKAHFLADHRATLIQAALAYWGAYGEAVGETGWDPDLEAFAMRHTLGCLLARVAGRSPLEYLTPDLRARQREIVLTLSASPLQTIPELISAFQRELSRA